MVDTGHGYLQYRGIPYVPGISKGPYPTYLHRVTFHVAQKVGMRMAMALCLCLTLLQQSLAVSGNVRVCQTHIVCRLLDGFTAGHGLSGGSCTSRRASGMFVWRRQLHLSTCVGHVCDVWAASFGHGSRFLGPVLERQNKTDVLCALVLALTLGHCAKHRHHHRHEHLR